MTDMTPSRTATEGTWMLPLLMLAPVVAIRLLTDLSTPWQVISWSLCGASLVLLAVGWAAVVRKGSRRPAAWGYCLVAHVVLVWQTVSLLMR
ncbi:hypothetical protein [Streptomyces sp. NPDC003023]|uniref:hypothetical protein n=1 Tax=Streptomyces sp. NPDC003023 TaxID=3364675 RepID=UPI0036958FB9